MKQLLLGLILTILPVSVSAQDRPLSAIAADLERLALELRTHGTDPSPTVSVPAGGDIAAAVTALSSTGGVVQLQPGAVYPPFFAPARAAGAPTITIRTNTTLADRTVAPADAPILATIAAANADGALRFEGTAGYTIDGVRLTMSVGTHEVVVIQGSDRITLDRVLFEAPATGQKRVVRGNGTHITLTRSYLNGEAWQGQDSQAFAAWEGAGPYTITRNTLMASGENVMFGGADNAEGTNPADILIDSNTIYKPQAWRQKPGSVKNLLELKNATRVTITNNLFDGSWTDAQSGWAIMLTPVNQSGTAPWSVVKDVVFARNVVVNAERGVNITGYGYCGGGNGRTQQAGGIVLRENVFTIAQQFLQVSSQIKDLTLEGNVVDQGYSTAIMAEGGICGTDGNDMLTGTAVETLTWTNNTHRDNGYGLHSEVGFGTTTLAARTLVYAFTGNRFAGLQYVYPPTTTAIDEAAFQAAKATLLAALGR